MKLLALDMEKKRIPLISTFNDLSPDIYRIINKHWGIIKIFFYMQFWLGYPGIIMPL